MGLRQRIRAVWLLAVFLLANAAPLFALGLTDGMAGMACCRKGAASCCKRKSMAGAPAFRAGQSCGTACCGAPAAPSASLAPETAPASAPVIHFGSERAATVAAGFPAGGMDLRFWQRPPPGRRA